MGKQFKGYTLPKDAPQGEQLDKDTIEALKRKDVNISLPVMSMKINLK